MDIIQHSTDLELDGIEYHIIFSVEISEQTGFQSLEHFGYRLRKTENELDFEIYEIISVTNIENDQEIILTKDFEIKLRRALLDWIDDNRTELAQKIAI